MSIGSIFKIAIRANHSLDTGIELIDEKDGGFISHYCSLYG